MVAIQNNAISIYYIHKYMASLENSFLWKNWKARWEFHLNHLFYTQNYKP